MKPFFTDKQTRKFTKEKFTYIFKQLFILLNPVKIPGSYHHIDISKDGRVYIKRIQTFEINENGIKLINKIELPFTDISIKTDNKIIEVFGENFSYKFPPDFMPEIWRRLKRKL